MPRMKRTMLLAALLHTACAAAPKPLTFTAPPAPTASPTQVCWLELGAMQGPGMVATSGWSTTENLDGTVSSILIRRPDGDLLIDAGNSTKFHEEIGDQPLLTWAYLEAMPGAVERVQTLPDALDAHQVDRAKLSIILSHVHADHAGGLVDVPDVPVLLSPSELRFVMRNRGRSTFHVLGAHGEAMKDRMRPIRFERKPYAIFDESADLFGDGSVVVVKLGGHTPGSIGVFVNVSPTLRVLHVGDVVMLREGYERNVGKSVVTRFLDNDYKKTGVVVDRLHQLHALDPELKILPAHDRAAWQDAFGKEPGCLPGG